MPSQILASLRPLAVPIETLHFDPVNARTHSDRNLDAIKASLSKFGQRKPIVVQRQGMVVRAGNGISTTQRYLGMVSRRRRDTVLGLDLLDVQEQDDSAVSEPPVVCVVSQAS